MAIFANFFEVELSKTQIEDILEDSNVQEENTFIENLWKSLDNAVNKIPVINGFIPLFKIMAFQYTDSIPTALAIILDMFALLTAWIIIGAKNG